MNINQIPDALLPFENPGEIAGVVIHLILGLTGALGVAVVLAATLPRKNNPSTVLLLSLCWADLVFCLSAVIFGIKGNLDLITDLAAGGWSSGKLGCILDTILVLGGCFASVLTILAITFERYLAVMHGKLLDASKVRKMIGAIWGGSLLIAFFPWYTGTYGNAIGLQPGRQICTVAWWDRAPMTIIMITLCLVTLAVSVSFIFYAYFMIVLKFMNSQAALRTGGKSTDKSSNADASVEKRTADTSKGKSTAVESANAHTTGTAVPAQPQKESSRDKEKVLLIKSIIISGTFIFCWSPYLVVIIYSLASGLPAPLFWDSLVSLCALCNSAVNPLLLFTLDKRIRGYVLELAGMQPKK
ncbi:hypothetical protein HDV04_002834 [Boothiomyces sp. JEL0838]|nr:hypothetical protein HDV04_002834 [Boothiomyces sp. JEL0838]